MKKVTLVYDPICPFAHRAWLALLEKGVSFDKIKVDITNKSEQFKDLHRQAYASDPNNTGMVPILIHGDNTLSESQLIVWFLAEEYETGNQLIPKDNILRVKMRWFIKSITSKFVSTFYSTKGLAKKSQEEHEKAKERVTAVLYQLEKSIEGPYVLGAEFSLADLMIYPWIERWITQKQVYGIEIPADCKKVLALKAIMEERPSVKETRKQGSDQFYLKLYRPYLLGDFVL